MPGKKVAVLYHGGCVDGFGGAWAAWKRLAKRAEYIPLYDRERPPSGLKGKELYFIDWTFDNPAITRELVKNNKRVVILDHHLQAEKIMRLAQEHVFSKVNSGAVIAWKYFHPHRPVPRLLKLIEDYDTWRLRFRDTAAAVALLDAIPYDFKRWSRLARQLEEPASRRRLLASGKLILAYKNKLVSEMVKRVKAVKFGKYEILALNSPILRNELGNLLAERKPPFSILWWVEGDKLRLSLRAVKPFNLLENVAGAKGHPQAAGLVLPKGTKLPWREL